MNSIFVPHVTNLYKCPSVRSQFTHFSGGAKGYQSTRHTVISSHGHVVTWSTRHRSTRHTSVSSQSTRHKRAYNKTYAMPCSSVWLFGFNVTCYDKDYLWQHLWAWKLEWNETLHIHVQHGKLIAACAISKSLTTAKLLNATKARWKSTVNSSQRRQTQRSTRHTILRCDELTVWRVDWFPCKGAMY